MSALADHITNGKHLAGRTGTGTPCLFARIFADLEDDADRAAVQYALTTKNHTGKYVYSAEKLASLIGIGHDAVGRHRRKTCTCKIDITESQAA